MEIEADKTQRRGQEPTEAAMKLHGFACYNGCNSSSTFAYCGFYIAGDV